MMVFFVMVLVLLAGAVPGHGRTESENTVFNVTQPHESMKNGTLSSSKFPYYYFYFAMQWPPSYCISTLRNIRCRQFPHGFTVHGLWPQYGPYDQLVARGGIDCTNSSFPRLNNRRIHPQIEQLLNLYWPDLTADVHNNRRFWAREYNKHGSCTFNSPNDYFLQSVRLAASLEHLASWLFSQNRRGPKIMPSVNHPYWPNAIRDAVKVVTNFTPRLSCVTVGRFVYLLEIRFCAVPLPDGIHLVDCNIYTDCGNGQVFLPPQV